MLSFSAGASSRGFSTLCRCHVPLLREQLFRRWQSTEASADTLPASPEKKPSSVSNVQRRRALRFGGASRHGS
jgi:hypothetical protein